MVKYLRSMGKSGKIPQSWSGNGGGGFCGGFRPVPGAISHCCDHFRAEPPFFGAFPANFPRFRLDLGYFRLFCAVLVPFLASNCGLVKGISRFRPVSRTLGTSLLTNASDSDEGLMCVNRVGVRVHHGGRVEQMRALLHIYDLFC